MTLRLLLLVVLGSSCGRPSESQPSADLGHGYLRPYTGQGLPLWDSGIGILDGLCTAFHLGNGVVATAGHCMNPQLVPGQPCMGQQILWEDGTKSQCVQILDYSNSEVSDFAMIEVDPFPASAFHISQRSPVAGEDIIVLGYPQGNGLHISDHCQFEPENQTSFRHNCNTRPGHSGSPIIEVRNYEILGIHNGNRNEQFNYGTQAADLLTPQAWQSLRTQKNQATQWQDFQNNEKQLLYHIPSSRGKTEVIFDFDVEEGYDFLYVQDFEGLRHTLTGRGNVALTLQSPVIVSFESDYSGQSKQVSMRFQ